MSVRFTIRKLLRLLGYDLVKFNFSQSPSARRRQLLEHHGIDLILDVGANAGRYALTLRRNGYQGRIVSFEPLSSAFAHLQKRAARDAQWDAVNVALGARNTTATINVARNSESSSLLAMQARHAEAAPYAVYTGTEDVTVCTLDSLFDTYNQQDHRIFLKIDAQGYERRILEGAQQTLAHITGLQLEMSLVSLYEGETLFTDMIAYVAERGFLLMSIEPGFCDPVTGQLLQIDGLFFRASRQT